MAYEDHPRDAAPAGLMLLAFWLTVLGAVAVAVFWLLHHLRWV